MRHSEHLLTKFLFRLSWEKSNWLELLEGLKNLELNRSWLELLEGLKNLELNRSALPGVDLPGVEIRS